jgi:hypothetical protein
MRRWQGVGVRSPPLQSGETVARSTDTAAHTLQRSQARSQGSVVTTVRQVQRFKRSIPFQQCPPSVGLQP